MSLCAAHRCEHRQAAGAFASFGQCCYAGGSRSELGYGNAQNRER